MIINCALQHGLHDEAIDPEAPLVGLFKLLWLLKKQKRSTKEVGSHIKPKQKADFS